MNSRGHIFSKWVNFRGHFQRVNFRGHVFHEFSWTFFVHENFSAWVNFRGHFCVNTSGQSVHENSATHYFSLTLEILTVNKNNIID
jgi:hypothetical protein